MEKTKTTFTLSEMLECWEVAQDSWCKEVGGDIGDIEDEDYTIPINKKAWFQDRFNVKIDSNG